MNGRTARIAGLLAAGVTLAVGLSACDPAAPVPRKPHAATRPAETQPAPGPTLPGGIATASRPAQVEPVEPAAPRKPARPHGTWATLVDAVAEDEDVAIDAKMTDPRRMLVRTENVRRLKLDLNRLPGGSADSGPWNLQIDGQGIEITGRRGRTLVLQRSDAGRWEVVAPR